MSRGRAVADILLQYPHLVDLDLQATLAYTPTPPSCCAASGRSGLRHDAARSSRTTGFAFDTFPLSRCGSQAVRERLQTGTTVLALPLLGRLPTGDLIAGGEFSVSGAVVLDRIARWNRNVWEAVAGGMPGLTSNVSALATTSDFELIAGGTFQTAGGVHSPNIARLQSRCRPQVAAYGTACGPHHLTATNLPWLGTTFQAQTT